MTTGRADHLHDPETYARSRETLRANRDSSFWSMTDRSSDCWEWTGTRQTRTTPPGPGYGILQRHGRRIYAHRYAYELAVGPIPARLEVLHRCDNPPCIRPSHLRLGTHAQNMADMAAKGRARPVKGQGHRNARLTDDDVRTIREFYRPGVSLRPLAEALGVALVTVKKVAYRKSWKHVA